MLSDNITNVKKKCICISCSNHYETRIRYIRDFFKNEDIDTIYITSNFNHFEKAFYKVTYPMAIQIAVPAYKKNISLKRIWSQIVFAWKAYEQIRTINPDIIYCMFPPNSLVPLVARYRKNHMCKVVFDGYDMWPESLPVHGVIKKIITPALKIWAGLRDWYIEMADLIVVVSESFVETAQKKWPKVPVKLLLPGIVPSEIPSYSFDVSDHISFCYLGNINYITDIDLLVEILGRVKSRKKVELHIIGEGQRLDELLSKANNAGIICHPHGVLMDEKAKRDIYSSCNLAINLPKEEIHSTMSLKSVEYMAVGLPYINTGGGDNWEIVEQYNVGVNIDRNNLEKSVRAILELTGNKLEEMKENCISYSNYRFESQNFKEILAEVLN